MRAISASLFVLTLALGTLLVGCAPAARPARDEVAGARAVPSDSTAIPPTEVAPPSATAGIPAPVEVLALQQQMREVHLELLQVFGQLFQLDLQRQQQVSRLMIDLMPSMGRFLASLQPVVDLMTPEERQASADNLRRSYLDLEEMYQLVPGTPPASGPSGSPSGAPEAASPGQEATTNLVQMGQRMDDLHRQMLAHWQQMDLDRRQGVDARMVDLAGNLDRLREVMGPSLGRISPEQRRSIKQQMDSMEVVLWQMVQVAGSPQGTPAPARTSSPITP